MECERKQLSMITASVIATATATATGTAGATTMAANN